MKKILFTVVLMTAGICTTSAFLPQKITVGVAATPQNDEKVAEIKFDTLSHDFGTFSVNDAVVKCSFTFTNVGKAPLIIHQAIASCGCTVPSYTKDPIKPGEKGAINVTYNGKGKFPGPFSKSITVRSNAKETGVVRLNIKGNMIEDEAESKEANTK